MLKRSLLALFVCVTVASQATNGIAQIGYGAKARGMGGASIALPQDVFTIANNPAGLVELPDQLDAGIHWLRQNGRFRYPQPIPADKDYIRTGRNRIWPEIGMNWRYCPNQAVGVALFSYGGFETLYDELLEGIGTSKTGMEYTVFFISPAWSWKWRYHSFGIAFNVCFAWTSIKGLQDLVGVGHDTSASETLSHSTNRGTDHEEGVSLRFGYTFRLPCSLAAGITFQTPTWINRFKNYKGFLAGRGDLDLPANLGVGLSYRLCRVTLAADALYYWWTGAKQFGNNFELGVPFGGPDGPGWGWKDQFVARVGAAWDVSRSLTLRTGYNYGTEPVRNDQIFLNILNIAIVQHHFTAGGSFRWGCNEVTLSFMATPTKTIHRNPSTTEILNPQVLHALQCSAGAAFSRKF